MAEPVTFCEAFQRTAADGGDRIALRTPDGSTSVTWSAYADQVRAIAGGLAGLGVGHGDTVALMMTNRPEFHLVDTAAFHLGATPFSIYNTLAPDQIAFVIGDSGARVAVCERAFAPALLAVMDSTSLEHVVCVDGAVDGTLALADLPVPGGFDFDAAWQAVQPDDVLTVIYTSGTTGPPKGVELTHANMLAEVTATQGYRPMGFDDRVVSYLPDAHVANRWGAHYQSLMTGMQVITVADTKTVIAAVIEARPTFFGAVPTIWYKLKAAIEAGVAAEPSTPKRKLATWAVDVGRTVARTRSDGRPVPPMLRARAAVADKLVLSKLRAKIGLDQVKLAASGAAPIAPEAMEFVLGLGLPVCEVWGMSETSAVATMNPPDAIRIGTVGTAVRGMEVTIADDGELLVRGPLVMKGYRNSPEKTAETIDADGWLHTGDIATIDKDGYVSIVDRKKELIINAAGKNMSPANIEGAVKIACPLAGSVVAIGDDRPYVVALITLDPDASAAFAAKHDLSADPGVLAANSDVHAAVAAGIEQANAKLSRVEQIKKFTILATVWEPGGDEVTPTMKLRRKPIAEKYAADIESLYS